MYDNSTNLEYQYDRLDDQLSDPDSTLPVELKAAVQAILTEENEDGLTVDARIERVCGEDAHLMYAQRYISREADRLNLRGDDAHESDLTPREKKACSCDDRYCKPKQGKLPRRVKQAKTLDAGVRQFDQEHAGHAYVLFESRDSYYGERADLKGTVRICRIALRNRTHPETIQEWGGLSAEDFTADGNLKNGVEGD